MFFIGVVVLTSACLNTIGTGQGEEGSGCTAFPAAIGGRGTMTFTFRPDLNMTSDTFHTYVIQTGQIANVVQCDRRNNAGITCDTINTAFNPAEIINHRLTLTAENVSSDLAGVYTLWSVVGGTKEPPVKCTFLVNNSTQEIAGETSSLTAVKIAVPVVCILLFVAIAVAVFVLHRRKRSSGDDTAVPMLSTDESENVSNKRWYFGSMNHENEADLAKFSRNKKGSFLVREDSKGYLTLAVLGEDRETKRFRIDRVGTHFKLSEADDKKFGTLVALVNHYKQHDMIIGGENVGRLVKPFERKPTGVWYAGKLSREEENQLFESLGKKEGSFFIRDNITYPDYYTLAVTIKGKTEHFRITVDDECFTFGDAQTCFKSLDELVQSYKQHDIVTSKGNFGKLGTPIQVLKPEAENVAPGAERGEDTLDGRRQNDAAPV